MHQAINRGHQHLTQAPLPPKPHCHHKSQPHKADVHKHGVAKHDALNPGAVTSPNVLGNHQRSRHAPPVSSHCEIIGWQLGEISHKPSLLNRGFALFWRFRCA